MISSRTQLITQNSGLQALSSKKSAKNQCVINSVQLLIEDTAVPFLARQINRRETALPCPDFDRVISIPVALEL